MTTPVGPQKTRTTTYLTIQSSDAFIQLRRRARRLIAALFTVFVGWFLATILLAGWAPDLFALEVAGNVNVGLLFVVGQILSTLLITAFYLRYARRWLDPLAERVRDEFERSNR
ncbi:DUF485 domain-containing protein [Phytoactinopolyspora limicola]|uniref:DUF485 domain-containing protein n=1 Tax=Phytoactinopolyspora limicola TaxID=2715536 RepID=UPI00140CE247|nr:DUF485 domain-containing protein [Phytoactinopolyspora limicola]